MQVYIVYIDYGNGLAKSEDLELVGICVFYLPDKEYQIIKLDWVATFKKYSLEEEIDQLVVNLGLWGYQALWYSSLAENSQQFYNQTLELNKKRWLNRVVHAPQNSIL